MTDYENERIWEEIRTLGLRIEEMKESSASHTEAQEIFIQTISRDFGKIEEVLREFLLEKPLTQFTRNKLLEKLDASGGEKTDVMYPIEGNSRESPHNTDSKPPEEPREDGLIEEEWINLRNKNIVFVKREKIDFWRKELLNKTDEVLKSMREVLGIE